jgi:hypothetical protein
LLTCKKFYEELNLLLDDDSACELKRELERHMRECPNCYVVFDTCRKSVSIVKSVCGSSEPEALPAGLKGKLMAALKSKIGDCSKGN